MVGRLTTSPGKMLVFAWLMCMMRDLAAACIRNLVLKSSQRLHGYVAQDVEEPEARAAFIWILGEYGQRIQVRLTCTASYALTLSTVICSYCPMGYRLAADLFLKMFMHLPECQCGNFKMLPEQDAPYLLEPLGAGFSSEPVPVRLALLAAAGKLFFARPPECQRLLGSVLAAASADPNQDVHDRALLYYRCCNHLFL